MTTEFGAAPPVAVRDSWRTDEAEALLDAIVRLETRDEAALFLRDLCTLGELRNIAQRWAVARLLEAGMHYAQISEETGASTATITRIASWLHHGDGGYRLLLDRLNRPEAGEARTGAAKGRASTTYPAGSEA
jgi:TrpR-related protein YerC/YecD